MKWKWPGRREREDDECPWTVVTGSSARRVWIEIEIHDEEMQNRLYHELKSSDRNFPHARRKIEALAEVLVRELTTTNEKR